MNSNPIKTPKKTYAILAAGVVLGAAAMATVMQGTFTPKAIAQKSYVRTIGNMSAEDMTLLRDMNDSFASLAEYIAPAVVNITVRTSRQSDMFGRRLPESGGEGSGVIFRADGYILTNDHVVGAADKVTVILNDGREFDGKVIRSSDSDLAVVKVDATNLPTVQFADSNTVKPGQFAIAVGSPFGLENSVTIGHVSALGRQSSAADPSSGQRRDYADLIQTDAAINRGNSGGPLLDIEGRVIGINTVIYSTTGGSMGIGFAIPSNLAKLTAEMLIEKGKIVKGYLGVLPLNLKEFERKELGIEGGAKVSYEALGSDPSPAKVAGIQEGDIITRIGNYPIKSHQDLRYTMYKYAPNDSVTIEFLRNKVKKTATVKLLAPPVRSEDAPVVGRNEGSSEQMPNMEDFLRQYDEGSNLTPEDPGRIPPIAEKPRLGVQIDQVTEEDRKTYFVPTEVSGVIVRSVVEGSPAARLGIKEGDVIVSIDGNPVRKTEDVTKLLGELKSGDSKRVKYARYSKHGSAMSESTVRF